MEPLIHEYMDYFISRMKELGGAPTGVGLAEWTSWLAMDLSADLSWSEKMHNMRESKLLPGFTSLLWASTHFLCPDSEKLGLP